MRAKPSSSGLSRLVMISAAVFAIMGAQAAAQSERVLHNFNNNGKDGFGPVSSLIADKAGNLYGTTEYGGTGVCTLNTEYPGCGTVFELSPKPGGGWGERILHSFVHDGTDGNAPMAGLIFDAEGNLYGTTYSGGAGTSANCVRYGCGTVFELSPNGDGTWTEKILHSFTQDGVDGVDPETNLIFDSAGNLYGTTDDGGANYYYGTVFELSPTGSGNWTEKILHSFNNNGVDAFNPSSGVVFDAAGNLYGETYLSGGGSIYQLSPTSGGAWTETLLYTFQGGNDGYTPAGELAVDASGDLYGATIAGGSGDRNSGSGTVFELSPQAGGAWTEAVLHHFSGSTDGQFPYGGVILDGAGNLYGTTIRGAHSTLCLGGCGSVFKVTPGSSGVWSEKLLNSFGRGKDGQYPNAGLMMDANGNLYGTTFSGGLYGYGTVFEIMP